jgi:tRNA pseudouridine38-40 synthase
MSKHRYFIRLSYIGTGFCGWQVQPGKRSIQGVLDSALSLILQEEIKCTGAGRTDTGVHAKRFVAHFDSVKSDLHKRQNTIFRLNRVLPFEIAVISILPVKDNAHARFDAISRRYEYTISKTKDPFQTGLSLYRTGQLDIEAMNQAAKLMMYYRDFTSFSKLHTDVKTNNCHITSAFWKEDNNLYIFTITADRFLRNMVRAIVGTMLDIGSGKISPEGIKTIIEAKDRGKAGKSVKAEGLSLVEIEYPPELFI